MTCHKQCWTVNIFLLLLKYVVVVTSEDKTNTGMIPSLEYKGETETETLPNNKRKARLKPRHNKD